MKQHVLSALQDELRRSRDASNVLSASNKPSSISSSTTSSSIAASTSSSGMILSASYVAASGGIDSKGSNARRSFLHIVIFNVCTSRQPRYRGLAAADLVILIALRFMLSPYPIRYLVRCLVRCPVQCPGLTPCRALFIVMVPSHHLHSYSHYRAQNVS